MLKFLIATIKNCLVTSSISSLVLLTACSDFLTPVKSTPAPTEFEYNYWLLQRTYLFEDELDNLPETGDSVQILYRALKDPYTRYIVPSKSEAAETSINTSFVPGDIGVTYLINDNAQCPIYIYRVYPNGPAGKAGVPRYANIRSINGNDLCSANAYSIYNSVLDTSAAVELFMTRDSTEYTFKLEKESVYAPTIFVDTLYGTIFVTITEFKLNTADMENGTYGELRAYLDSTKNSPEPRVIDIRGNPGGHVEQCVSMADLFVKKGTLSTRSWRAFDPDGTPIRRDKSIEATAGDPGEGGKFILLADSRSASCAEIFAAAVTENTDIPLAGTTTFGKGIGQTNWKTKDGGLAIITNLEFLTPKGNSYHHKGIVPDYTCDIMTMTSCAVETVEKVFGTKKAKLAKRTDFPDAPIQEIRRYSSDYDIGGAILQEKEFLE